MKKQEEMVKVEDVVIEVVGKEEDLVEKELSEEELVKIAAQEKSMSDLKAGWQPKTSLGKKVKEGIITDFEEILDQGAPLFEPEIIDILVPQLESDLLMIGQAKGKFGGGQRRVFRQTQKKTAEGNKPNFATCVVVGNKNGYFGVGYGKSKETVPARDKAMRRAKLSLKKIRRGCGSWECGCHEPHSIPYMVEGKCGSIRLLLIPAPRGKGLVAQKEIQKILRLAGISDVWSKASGDTRTTLNLVYACIDALNKLVSMKVKPDHIGALGICEGVQKGVNHG